MRPFSYPPLNLYRSVWWNSALSNMTALLGLCFTVTFAKFVGRSSSFTTNSVLVLYDFENGRLKKNQVVFSCKMSAQYAIGSEILRFTSKFQSEGGFAVNTTSPPPYPSSSKSAPSMLSHRFTFTAA